MPRIALTHVIYDVRRACFRARAKVDGQRDLACRWHGPQTAGFARIAAGLHEEARRRLS